MLANAARRRYASSELEWIDRELDKLTVVAAYALKNGDLKLCQKAIQAKLSGIRQRISTRQLLEAEERDAKQRAFAEAHETVCTIDGCPCGGKLSDHRPQCVVRRCNCNANKHYLLRRDGPYSKYVWDLSELDENGRTKQKT